jgi:predicted HTH domain antitoxin
MRLTVPSDLLQQTGYTEHTLRQEVAILFYRTGKVSLGKAAEFAQLHKMAFQRLLAEKGIPLQYDVADLKEDLETLSSLSE